ncbi:MAG: hypothetical protein GVY29_03240 [Spirochaetes bacterium]|nr:hypothetical protein [Spirochaetota bacterium]
MATIVLVLPLFVLIALGYALKKLAFMTEDLVSGLNRLVYYIALPVMLFGETARLTTLPQSFGTAAAVYSIAVVIVTVLALLLTVGRPAGKRGSFTQATSPISASRSCPPRSATRCSASLPC